MYEIDDTTEPASARLPMQFIEVYIAAVEEEDFRKNSRGELGTRTATLHAEGVKKLRDNWVYRVPSYSLTKPAGATAVAAPASGKKLRKAAAK